MKDEKEKGEIKKDIEEEKKVTSDKKIIVLEKAVEWMANMMYMQGAEIEKIKEITTVKTKKIKKIRKQEKKSEEIKKDNKKLIKDM